MTNLQEVDASGNPIANTGNRRHGFPNFSTVNFTYSSLESVLYQGFEAYNINFSSPLVIDSTDVNFRVEIYIFREDGNITIDGESTIVAEGDLKLNVVMDNWPFCEGEAGSPCQGNTGAAVDFEIEVRGAKDPRKLPNGSGSNQRLLRSLMAKPPRPVHFAFSDNDNGQALFLSTRVNVDGEWQVMPDEYPKKHPTKPRAFILRFPKFSSEVLYDPVISLGVDDSSTNSGGDTGSGASPISMALSAMALLGWAVLRRRD